MDKKNFKFWNRITALVVFAIATITYMLTLEPTASFWDCGEFIASSYKLEVGHPPGNPVFQLFARIFTLFSGPETAALAVNAMNGLCSSLTILLLYLTIVFLVKRLFRAEPDGTYSFSRSIIIMGSAAVGALSYAFTDTFWFSAVEGEVYAMSSLFTALVFWAMTKWYEQADEPYANRWIVLISFIMGLSIGVHLLNLLTIPALVFLFYFRKRDFIDVKGFLITFAISIVLLAIIFYGIIPYLPRIAAYFDLFFVNTLGLPFNSGAAFFMILLLVLCFWGIFYTMKAGKALLNTALLCFTVVVIGFSLFTIVIIRSNAKTPTNEYQPDNPFTLVRYLGREQYGSNPLIYGQYYGSDIESEETTYYAPFQKDGKDYYLETAGAPEYKYSDEMFFPRMWSTQKSHVDFYKKYVKGDKPNLIENIDFFFDFQMDWMYWRYFMWNFAGRQNDVHSPSPGNPYIGNWESGISWLDEKRLGDQSDIPDYLADNKGKNHYYMLPLLLGLIGLCFQFARDKRGWWVTSLMFFMTGIAIVIYLNQPPYQVRERDYAYAGSFYTFAIWIGLGVAAIYACICNSLKSKTKRTKKLIAAYVTTVSMGVPVLLATENWDDHDRSNRYTAVEMAKNYLNSVGENGILVTHGDNDTFPLWYAQEVEGVRTDVRIANTSLLGTDWYIDQMTYASNESAPLKLSIDKKAYLYGTNDAVYVDPYSMQEPMLAADIIKEFNDPVNRLYIAEIDGERSIIAKDSRDPYLYYVENYDGDIHIDSHQYVPTSKIAVPVNKENVLKYGILDEKYADQIPEMIVLDISGGYILKSDLFFIDLLAEYQWDRPLHFLSKAGDIALNFKDYLQYDGFSYKFVPIKTEMEAGAGIGLCDADRIYDQIKNDFSWDALSRTDYFVDYQNFYTFCGVLSQRQIFVNAAQALMDKAYEYEEELHVWNEIAMNSDEDDICRSIAEEYAAKSEKLRDESISDRGKIKEYEYVLNENIAYADSVKNVTIEHLQDIYRSQNPSYENLSGLMSYWQRAEEMEQACSELKKEIWGLYQTSEENRVASVLLAKEAEKMSAVSGSKEEMSEYYDEQVKRCDGAVAEYKAKVEEILDMCQESVPAEMYPLDISYLDFTNEYLICGMVELYYQAGATEKAEKLASAFVDELFDSLKFYYKNHDRLASNFQRCHDIILYLLDILQFYGNTEMAHSIVDRYNELIS